MVTAHHPQSEPTPEFNQRCVEAITAWHNGTLPFRDVVKLFKSYAQEAQDSGHLANQARAEHGLGYIQHYGGNLNTSIKHYEEARRLYKRAINPRRVATIDLNQGENYRTKGDFNKALRQYRAAYDAAERLGDITVQTMAAVNEGLVLMTVGQDAEALQAFSVAHDLAAQWTEQLGKRDEVMCELYYGMAVVYLRAGELETAWDAALHAFETARNTGQPLRMGFANRTVAEVISELGQSPDPRFTSDPDVYFRAALTAFRDINAEIEVARTMYAQALSLAKRGRRTTAGRMLQEVMIIFTNLEMVDAAARAAEAQRAVL